MCLCMRCTGKCYIPDPGIGHVKYSNSLKINYCRISFATEYRIRSINTIYITSEMALVR